MQVPKSSITLNTFCLLSTIYIAQRVAKKSEYQGLFKENASQPMSVWLENGWITEEDPLGWVQWYTRYFHGRRIPELDNHQQKRWRSFVARHSAQVKKNGAGDLTKRLKQRQALLHWGADPIPDMNISNDEKISFLFKIIAKKTTAASRSI